MPQQIDQLADSPKAIITTNHGDIVIQFYTQAAPELSNNFIELAKSGYYDNLTFHRIVPGFVIQGGDPNGDGTGGESYTKEGLADEPGALALKHIKGAVACAKSSLPNSIGSQFYIAIQDVPMLDGEYSVFGQVVEGIEVVDKIAQVETDAQDKPKELVKILKVTVT
ncbi:MAG: peptidylprolyl isomerase [bacterium]